MALRKLLTKWSRLMLLATLLLSGCFRPAGDSIQPTSNSTVQTSNQALASATPISVTSGAPPITLLSPDTPVAASTSSQPLPALTQITVIPFAASATPTESTGLATATLQIITPGISLDLITPDTPTPLPTQIPGAESTGAVEAATSEPAASSADCTYAVEAGDNLYVIAVRNNVTVADMQSANPDLSGDAPILQIGQVLKLPNCTPGQTSEAPSTVSVTSTPTTAPQTYTVKPGDTLYGIATHFGITVNAIMRANSLSDPNRLSIGQSLIIPAKP